MIIEAALATAQIAPLVAQFLRERANERVAVTEEDFRRWLQDVAFPQLLSQSSTALQAMVSLKATEAERYKKLESLLQEIRMAVGPNEQTAPALSLQAISILEQIIDSGTSEMIAYPYLAAPSYSLIGGRSLVFDAPRYLADDLDQLVHAKFLKRDYTAAGNERLRPTRLGETFIADHKSQA